MIVVGEGWRDSILPHNQEEPIEMSRNQPTSIDTASHGNMLFFLIGTKLESCHGIYSYIDEWGSFKVKKSIDNFAILSPPNKLL